MSSWSDEHEWCEEQFSGAFLGDERRSQRAVTIAEAMVAHPGRSIPQLFDRPYDIKAAYNLLRHPEVTPDALQGVHRSLVVEEMHQPGVYLLIEDSSDLSWAGNKPVEGLGPIGTGAEGLQGFQLHTVLAVRWPETSINAPENRRPLLELLGLADQQFYVRPPKASKQPGAKKRKFNGGELLESHLWEQASARIGAAPDVPGTRWVRVADAGADIYEFLLGCQQYRHDFVVRACQNRVMLDASGNRVGTLFEQVRQAPITGKFNLELRARPGQAARTAQLSIRVVPVSLRSPQRPGHGPGALAPIACTAIHIGEEAAPAGADPLDWTLLTNRPITSFEEALTCGLQYAARWLIEEFHKALKTGLKAERLQLERAGALFAAISLMSVVALRLIDLRERLRWTPDAPAVESGLDPLELTILARRLNRNLQTVRDVVLAIGRLGGHMNRKNDGPPGWQTLWLGMQELQTLTAGARLGAEMLGFG